LKKKNHPYSWRLKIRGRLPWFLINLGIADKGKNCEDVGAEHLWYNIDDKNPGCYYCKVEKEGQLWKEKT
jgi:hypothetical protein